MQHKNGRMKDLWTTLHKEPLDHDQRSLYDCIFYNVAKRFHNSTFLTFSSLSQVQARNQLATPGEAKIFLSGVQIFELCPIVLYYVQHIFPGGRNKFWGVFSLCALPPLVAGLLMSFAEVDQIQCTFIDMVIF